MLLFNYLSSPRSFRRRQSSFVATALVAMLALGFLTACSGDSANGADGSKKPLVIATTPILGELVEAVGGEDITVEVLIPLGADPHDFEPSAAQAARLRDASLIVANGLGLEQQLESSIDGARRDGVTVYEVGEELDPLAITESHEGSDHADAEAEDGHGSEDPHVWLDPERMATAASLVAGQLAATTGGDAAGFQSRAATYADSALAAQAEAIEILSVVPADQLKLVTNHDALEYFANRFNLVVIGTVIPGGSTMAEPSAADLSGLVELIKANNVKAIFSESTVSAKLIETVSGEVGSQVQVVELSTDTLGEPGSDTATYPGLIVSTARLIANGLTGR